MGALKMHQHEAITCPFLCNSCMNELFLIVFPAFQLQKCLHHILAWKSKCGSQNLHGLRYVRYLAMVHVLANFRNSGAPLEFKVEAMSLSMFSMCDIVFLFKSHSLLYRKFVHQQNKDHHLKLYKRRAQ